MNDDLFMNDTFDNFTFTPTEISKSSKEVGDINSKNGSVKSNHESAEKDEISFDDSFFLSESFSFTNSLPKDTFPTQEISTNKEKQENVLKESLQNEIIENNPKTNLRTGKENTFLCKLPKKASTISDSLFIEAKKGEEGSVAFPKVQPGFTNKKLLKSPNKTQENSTARIYLSSSNLNIVQHKANSENKTSFSNQKLVKTLENLQDHNIIKENFSTKLSSNLNVAENKINSHNSIKNSTEISPEACKLSNWGLPDSVLQKYESRNLKNMFPWQVECLNNQRVLNEFSNLVYSAPTSAGKTLVAEILALKTIFERRKKVIFILPFVSIVREKMYYFQDILGTSGIRVEGFMGSYNPPGGFQSIHFAICTIEKANSLINKLLKEEKLGDIGAILVDEMHLLGDHSRGYLLELLLTKLRYISLKDKNVRVQIIGMSATLPNLGHLAKWLDAELYTTTFRPIPLHEQAHVCGEIYDNNLKLVRKLGVLPELGTDTDNILQLCLETIKESCSILIFCPTKIWCESLAQQAATAICKIGNSTSSCSELLRSQLKTDMIIEVLEQLKNCPVGLDEILHKTVSFGVAFHHAGLTMDERDIIEAAFRNGAIRILVATSTLSSGVNLPARRVIIRTPNFHGKPIDTLTYRQMIGRAGRMGKDTMGESILICQKNDYRIAKELMSADLQPVESCLQGAGKLKRAILEVIASGVASSPDDVNLFTKCTLLAVAVPEKASEDSDDLENPIEEAMSFLQDNEFIRLQKMEDGSEKYAPTSLGKACLSSSMAPDEGLALFTELERARQCFVLETELHLIYLVTPYNACNSWGNIDWMFYLDLWEKLPSSMKRVGELVGVRDSYIVSAARGKIQTTTSKLYQRFLVHKRFFVALALQDLVNEKSLGEVCAKFSCNRGMLQSLQQSASSFAGMVTSFSHQLGWSSVEILLSQFQDRMQFGVSRDLLDLMRLPVLNGKMARTLYNAGIETVVQLANSEVELVENVLHKVMPFESAKEREGESEFDNKQRNKFRTVWVTGKEGLTEREAAEMLVRDARGYLKIELGLAEAKWEANGHGGSGLGEEIVQDYAKENASQKESESQVDETSSPKTEDSKNNVNANPENINKIPLSPFDLNTSNEPLSVQATNEDDPNNVNKVDLLIVSANLNNSENSSIFSEGSAKNDTETNLLNNDKTDVPSIEASSSLEDLNVSNFSNAFSELSFTKIEETENNNLHPKQTTLSFQPKENSDQHFKTPRQSITLKNDISQIFLSPSPVELNISNSSIFSPHGSVNISIEKMHSDQSLFEDSFTLHLSNSDSSKDNGIKENKAISNENLSIMESGTFLEKAFSSSFEFDKEKVIKKDTDSSTDDILTSSQEMLIEKDKDSSTEDILTSSQDLDRKRSRKRTRNSNEGQSDDILEATPSKKKKQLRSQRQKKNNLKGKSSECYTQNKIDTEECVDFSKLDVVLVASDITLIDAFSKEIRQKTCIALSVACSKVAEHRPLIGLNIIKPEKEPSKFRFKDTKVDGFAVTWHGSVVYYLSLENDNNDILNILKNLLGNSKLTVRMFDSKEQIKVLKHCCDVNLFCKIEDPKVADWILEPEGKEKNLQAMAVLYCPEVVKLAQLSGSCRGTGSVGLDLHSSITSKIRASIESTVTWHLVDSLKTTLNETHPSFLNIHELEMGSIMCLAKMEISGMSVSKLSLQKLVDTLNKLLSDIEKKAYSSAGRHFNFTSSADVAKVIGMFRGKKVSTRKEILERNEHPISDLVLQWRKINCTLTKMIYPLIRITEEERIRGCYVTHTATGRITMHEPNLQSVAKDFQVVNPLTKESVCVSCRSAFLVPDGFLLISADYCQLELRILASLSRDSLLCEIMKKPGDVFKSIAAKWNNVEEDMVDDSMRQNTKHLCYGIIYGMGSKTLAEQLAMEEEDAIVFMETFKNRYPGIKKFIKETIEKCGVCGYVETITGRRRYLPHIKEANNTLRGQAERQAVNTTVQGSAADMAKKAMVLIDEQLEKTFKKSRTKPKLTLHLHDELIYEVPEKYIGKVAKIMKKCMENAVELTVPFPVKVKTGKSWGRLTEYNL